MSTTIGGYTIPAPHVNEFADPIEVCHARAADPKWRQQQERKRAKYEKTTVKRSRRHGMTGIRGYSAKPI